MSENKKSTLKIKSWYSNRYQIVVVQRNILLIFTLVSMFSVAISIIFVKTVMSSKSLEPYVIELEEKSGIATVVDQVSAGYLTGDQAVRRFFINKYIHLASGYDPKTYIQDSDEVRLFSVPGIYAEYRSRINPRELGATAKVSVRIKSILFQAQGVAQVRVVRQIDIPEVSSKTVDEVITLGFYFAPNIQLSTEERLINPLGFQVNQYSVAEEVFSY
ncbi:MAG: virB8 family protein [Alphaproteobacteria bacterium]